MSPPAPRWELSKIGLGPAGSHVNEGDQLEFDTTLQRLLRQGWEPFAVNFVGYDEHGEIALFVYHLRRMAP